MHTDNGVDTLLDLNGNIVQQEHGFWVEIHAWRVESTALIPHGVRYALTLHEQNGKRVMGYDNAHGVKPFNRFKYAGQVLPYDHKPHFRSRRALRIQGCLSITSGFFR